MNKNKIVCIIQARMGSSRLPGKVIRDLCGKPMIEHIYDRVKKVKLINEVIIATTTSNQDNILCNVLEQKNIKYYRGSEDDVLGRYTEVAKKTKADIIIRITGDCPLVDPMLINDVIKRFLEKEYDYMSPKSECGLIRGLDTEIFTFDALKKADVLAKDNVSREHVTLYMYRNPDKFKIGLFPIPAHLNNTQIRLTVDEIQDYRLINTIYNILYEEEEIIKIQDVLELLYARKDLIDMNVEVKQKKI